MTNNPTPEEWFSKLLDDVFEMGAGKFPEDYKTLKPGMIKKSLDLISSAVLETRIAELESLESNMISSDSQWYAIGERITELKSLKANERGSNAS